MSKAMQTFLVLLLVCCGWLIYFLSAELERERNRPIVLEGMVDTRSGDVFIRLQHRPEIGARFPKMCSPRYPL